MLETAAGPQEGHFSFTGESNRLQSSIHAAVGRPGNAPDAVESCEIASFALVRGNPLVFEGSGFPREFERSFNPKMRRDFLRAIANERDVCSVLSFAHWIKPRLRSIASMARSISTSA